MNSEGQKHQPDSGSKPDQGADAGGGITDGTEPDPDLAQK
jgi:hypothetical protein